MERPCSSISGSIPDEPADAKVFNMIGRLSKQSSSLKVRIQTVAHQIHRFHQTTQLLKTMYQGPIQAPIHTASSPLFVLMSQRISELSAELAALNNRETRLQLLVTEFNDKMTALDNRVAIAQDCMSDPIDDLDWIEVPISNLESEVHSMIGNLSGDFSLHEAPEEIQAVDFQSRSDELRRRITEIRKQKALLLHKSPIAVRKRPEKSALRPRFDPPAVPGIDVKIDTLNRRQQALDSRNKEVDAIEGRYNSDRIDIESSYATKLSRVSRLTEQLAEVDKLQIALHNLSRKVDSAKNELLNLRDDRRRLERSQASHQAQSQVIQQEAAKSAKITERLVAKEDTIRRRDREILRRRSWIQQEQQSMKGIVEQLEERERLIIAEEEELADTERKCDELNEQLNREAEEVDKVLFQASSLRADSRIHRLQALLDARTESTIIDRTFGTTGGSVMELIELASNWHS
jgi:chromosome segregation ATPase